jgi:hypothetical protein
MAESIIYLVFISPKFQIGVVHLHTLKRTILSLLVLFATLQFVYGQAGDIRGFIYNANTGDRLSGAIVYCETDKRVILSDGDGYYTLAKLPAGKHIVIVTAAGFDTSVAEVIVFANANSKSDHYLNKVSTMDVVNIKDRRKVTNAAVGNNIDPKNIYRIPTIGGEPDILQYLQILPGVVFSGDQGGQLYIRGGSPIMNKVTLDGMTIYNPFHSIGLFSVFETDLIRTADVYTAGFGAEYGGRVSAVVDIKTRDGNKTKLTGKAGVTTFTSKLLLEGPVKRFSRGNSNSSFTLSYRNSYLKQSSRIFYNFANPDKLPYNFGDLFGKFSMNGAGGGYANLYAFRFSDNVDFPNTTSYNWVSSGVGGKFLVVPDQAKTRIDGYFLYSKYQIEQNENDGLPRRSGIGGFNLGMNFSYNFKKDQFKWGLELNGFQTDFQLYNANRRFIQQLESTTEINTFTNYKVLRKKFIADIGVRWQYYASLGNGSLEPRVQFKYMPVPWFALKGAAGMYSQNLLSAISDRDVVNLFYGFLSGPDNLPKTFDGKDITHSLQKARHAVLGTEYMISKRISLNTEVFYKYFPQITNINRDKLFNDDVFNQNKPARLRQDYIIEKGDAYGADATFKYDQKPWYLWAVYSITWVNRYDGFITYQPIFDRRHNANILLTYSFDKRRPTEISFRWNFGSGFPFTQTQGYYEKFDFLQGLSGDYTQGNGKLGILYDQLNGGRLPYYHRLDFSVKRTWKMKNKNDLQAVISITNVYNRANIFYYDRVNNIRVNQLPFLPSAGCNYTF